MRLLLCSLCLLAFSTTADAQLRERLDNPNNHRQDWSRSAEALRECTHQTGCGEVCWRSSHWLYLHTTYTAHVPSLVHLGLARN